MFYVIVYTSLQKKLDIKKIHIKASCHVRFSKVGIAIKQSSTEKKVGGKGNS